MTEQRTVTIQITSLSLRQVNEVTILIKVTKRKFVFHISAVKYET